MPVQPIEYATGPRRRERRFTVVHMTIWLSVVSVATIGLTCSIIPKFESIFKEFDTELPALTKLVLMLSRFCRDYFGWIILLLLPAVPAAFDRLNDRRWKKEGVPRRARILFGFLMLMSVVAFALVIVSIFLPMISPGGGISSPKPVGH